MVEYKLTVVGYSDGTYAVNYYPKAFMQKKDSLPEVVEYISKLEKTVLKAEPCYAYIKKEEIKLFEMIRKIILMVD